MNRSDFWRMIDATRGLPERLDALARGLSQLGEDEIVRFRIIYDDLINEANKIDLWAAAHLINGGCSEEEFYPFREGLIELGQRVYEAAVTEPDSLATYIKPSQRVEATEGLGSAPAMAWMAKTGSETEDDFFEAVDAADEGRSVTAIDEGEWWNFRKAEEVRHRLPRLTEKFLKDEAE
jgi:hypothetical protein